MRTIGIIVGVIILGSLLGYALIVLLPQVRQNATQQSTTSREETSKKKTMNNDLKIEDTQVGSGDEVKSGDTIVIHYKGTLENGTQFDSSYDRGQPFETQIGVGRLIKGWDQGIPGMKVGGKRKLTIAPELGYGSQDMGSIPPNSTLIFEVELIDIK